MLGYMVCYHLFGLILTLHSGVGALPIANIVEDLATAEISRVWHIALTPINELPVVVVAMD